MVYTIIWYYFLIFYLVYVLHEVISVNFFFVAVDLRLVKEIRLGIHPKDYSRIPDEVRSRQDPALCFLLLSGSEFRLKPLSVGGLIWESDILLS
jgi:hypothetical protein